ncbi:MAG: FAD-dependent oxidoreductase [Clostridiales bacterium]|nr:FAD-dependent oxidoreductase [Clostridiales bacterium]
MNKYDIIVIGFGKAGKTLAAGFAAEGKKVAIIEKDENMYGGTCINVGCIPSKSLVVSSQKAVSDNLGTFDEKAVMYREAILQKRRVTKLLRDKNFQRLDQLSNVDVILGTAQFVDKENINVKTGSGTMELNGDKIIVNAGSTSVILPIPGIEANPYVFTSATLMDLEKLPKKLIIVGGGYIGLEFASMYAGFGSQVTVIQDGERLIPREDKDVAHEIQKALEDRGVIFNLGAKIEKLEKGKDMAKVFYEWQGQKKNLEGEAVLLATGRRPNVEDLHLEKAGIETDPRGAIIVDEKLKTNVKNIWAAGDVNGGLQFTYVSLDDYRVIWSQIHGGDYNREKRHNVPYSVFLSPTFSRVGINEEEARKEGHDIKVMKMPVGAVPKAHVLGKTTGFLKALTDKKTDKILGAMLFCEDSHEMINIVKLAMDMGATGEILKNQIFTHPTMSEALNDLFSL